MKRFTLIMAAALFLSLGASADEGEARPAFAVMVGPSAAIGITGAFAGGQAVFVWKPGLLGAQLGARVEAGLKAPDVYAVPSVGARLGWLVLEGGLAARMADGAAPAGMTEARIEEGATPFFRVGLAIPMGPLSLDAGARFMATDAYAELGDSEADTIGDAIGEALGDAIGMALLTVFGMAKIDASLRYAIRF